MHSTSEDERTEASHSEKRLSGYRYESLVCVLLCSLSTIIIKRKKRVRGHRYLLAIFYYLKSDYTSKFTMIHTARTLPGCEDCFGIAAADRPLLGADLQPSWRRGGSAGGVVKQPRRLAVLVGRL